MPITVFLITVFTLFTAFKTPLPLYLESLSLSSKASRTPVDAPLGTAARPTIPFSNITSTSTVISP